MISQLTSTKGKTLSCLIIAAGMSATSSIAYAVAAQPYVTPRPSAIPMPGLSIPDPTQVTGKEYSNNTDEDFIGVPDPMQVLNWDGLGGVTDGVDFGTEYEVDAIANAGDLLFNSVISNNSALLYSTAADGNIYSHGITGASGLWATPPVINANHAPYDVDGLEVWGADQPGDSDRYSIAGDLFGESVYDAAGIGIISTVDIATAIGIPSMYGQVDLDALMFNSTGTNSFDILFSIAPIAGIFDGGEIWTWSSGAAVAAFLNQGGHVWDTIHCVVCEYDSVTENINALEAVSSVPVPAAVWLFGSGLLGLIGVARRKK